MLYEKSIKINDDIEIVIPTVGQVLDNEDAYDGLVTAFTAMPIDLMVQLDDIGVDYAAINDYQLFCLLFPGLQSQDTKLLFGDLDLKKFVRGVNEKNGTTVFVDKENDIVIDRGIYSIVADTLRKIHFLEKNKRKPANEEARAYLLERERKKLERRKRKKTSSQLETLIISLVNTEQFKYTFEGTRELSIYQFNASVRQVARKVDFDNKMYGIYSGNIDVKDLNQNDLNWLNPSENTNN